MRAYIKIDGDKKTLTEVKSQDDLDNIKNGAYELDNKGREMYMLGYLGGLEDRQALTKYADDLAYQTGFIDGCKELKESKTSAEDKWWILTQ